MWINLQNEQKNTQSMKLTRKRAEGELSEKPPFPRNMMVELTNACNHRCLFCAHKKMHRKIGFCDKDQMLSIIIQAYELGTREIGFYLAGETLLSKDLEFLVDKCKHLGFEYIYLTTNGVYADKNRVKRLCELGLDSIKFSVDAATREVYQKIHGKDDFDIVKKNLFDVLALKKQNPSFGVFASFCIVKSNKEETELFKEYFGKYLDDVEIELAMEQGGETPELVDELVDPTKRLSQIPCERIFNRLHVTYEGYLNACCVDFENMLAYADLNKESLKDAWHNETITALRREHLHGYLSWNKCYNCVNSKQAEKIFPLSKALVQ